MLRCLLLLLFIKSLQKRFKLQPLYHGKGLFIKQLRNMCFFQRIIQLTVCLYGCKCLTEDCLLPSLFQKIMGSLRCHLIQMCICLLHSRKRCQYLYGCFLPDPGYSRNIVGSIPHKSLKVYDLRRSDAIFINNILRMVILNLCAATLCLWNPYHDPVGCKL